MKRRRERILETLWCMGLSYRQCLYLYAVAFEAGKPLRINGREYPV